MCRIICITNRKLVKESFITQLRKIVRVLPDAIILREKDIGKLEYEALANEVMSICHERGVKCILHTHYDVAVDKNADGIHLSMPYLRQYSEEIKGRISIIGASTHTLEEAIEAERLGATYVTASHIFKTDCKKGIEPKGLALIKEVSQSVSIPVYALGGINSDNALQCINYGASGVCMMSEFMKTDDPMELVNELKNNMLSEHKNGDDITLKELEDLNKNNYVIIDIRNEESFKLMNIPGSVNVPFPKNAKDLYELPKDKTLIVCCQKGLISRQITELLVDAGYNAYNLSGGFLEWFKGRLQGEGED